ncbi:MAG: helix-turn-helix transcriptional regulator [Kiritimatiellae bacterium]|nr:helix-turn-helix transcriptional regulator [Kiritimatiellia bacterium]
MKERETLGLGAIQPNVRMANYIPVKPDTRWGWRTIPDFELILIVLGRFAYDTRTRTTADLEPGDVLCIPPLEEHVLRRVHTPGGAIISCIHHEVAARGSWAQGDYALDPFPPIATRTHGDPVIRDLFHRCAETFSGYARYRAEMLQTITREIWLRLMEHWRGRPAGRRASRIKEMEAFLRERLRTPVTRRDLARRFSITPEHVNALFKKELGVTPTQFVHRERVFQAYGLLRDDGLSVKEAAARVGFHDPFYFSKIFKRILKVPPSRVGQRG